MVVLYVQISSYDVLILLDIIDNDCSLYAYEIKEELVARGGTCVSESTVRYWLHKLGFSHKKVWKYARRARLIREIAFWEYFYVQNYHVITNAEIVCFGGSEFAVRSSQLVSRTSEPSIWKRLRRVPVTVPGHAESGSGKGWGR